MIHQCGNHPASRHGPAQPLKDACTPGPCPTRHGDRAGSSGGHGDTALGDKGEGRGNLTEATGRSMHREKQRQEPEFGRHRPGRSRPVQAPRPCREPEDHRRRAADSRPDARGPPTRPDAPRRRPSPHFCPARTGAGRGSRKWRSASPAGGRITSGEERRDELPQMQGHVIGSYLFVIVRRKRCVSCDLICQLSRKLLVK